MTDLVHDAGAALVDWLQRNVAPVLAIVFSLGFAWAQFGAVEAAIAETRTELRELRREFVAFRVAGTGLARQDLADALVLPRDIDQRQDAAAAAMFDRPMRTAAPGSG